MPIQSACAAPAVAGLEAQVAEAIVDRPALVDLDRQRIVRSVAHDDVGAGVDRRPADVGHVLHRFAPEAPVARRDEDIDLRAQRRDILAELGKINGIGPGDDDRRNTRPVGRRNSRMRPPLRHLIGGVAAQDGDAGLSSLASWSVGQKTELRCRMPTRKPLCCTIAGARAAARLGPAPVCRTPISSSRAIEAAILAEP